jgi:hypothetical protein
MCLTSLTPDQILSLREQYLQQLQAHAPGARYIIDKTPMNYHYIGFILQLFPQARIVYCQRDPVDNCISIFRLPFEEHQGYSHQLTALGHYYRKHLEIMEFWQGLFAERIITVRYEDTVLDLETQARRMLAFVGVAFESAVLRFQDNERTVMTPSAEQVRQPIYNSSIGMSARYGDALGPLLEALRLQKTH